MHASPIYAGPDYAGLKRTEASMLVGVARSRSPPILSGSPLCSRR